MPKKRQPKKPVPEPRKLTPGLQAKLCRLIANGATYELACGKCRIDRKTYYNWRQLGKDNPGTIYGSLVLAVEFAEVDSEHLLVKTLLKHKSWQSTAWIMKNRLPQQYRDKVEQELSGPNGDAIPIAITPFQVIISGAADAKAEQQRTWEVVDYADLNRPGLS